MAGVVTGSIHRYLVDVTSQLFAEALYCRIHQHHYECITHFHKFNKSLFGLYLLCTDDLSQMQSTSR